MDLLGCYDSDSESSDSQSSDTSSPALPVVAERKKRQISLLPSVDDIFATTQGLGDVKTEKEFVIKPVSKKVKRDNEAVHETAAGKEEVTDVVPIVNKNEVLLCFLFIFYVTCVL